MIKTLDFINHKTWSHEIIDDFKMNTFKDICDQVL